MEKTMNEIIAFIEGAIRRDFCIEVEFPTETYLRIRIYNPNDYIDIACNDEDLYISTSKLGIHHLGSFSEEDILSFKIASLHAREYSKNKTLRFFDEFLGEEPSKKITNINDLDDDDA